ncbi:hypothetical protein EDEG_02166 [Edhazardia aedis USNM 41457]|uniref:Ricin B lectin domain-containing protein n=1 Tax=Edhazardia aedis (strain USNM 41457) TaxID=1003232 RepID=J9DQ69_EDHAE|nr:hypothetical protein EDEG_02166 [Edhazardia aedis USNM 41457]|eukprot:EJW03492.1 hypothetical protein EDEG_02166 [Edhazardia aedis USNM 41457]
MRMKIISAYTFPAIMLFYHTTKSFRIRLYHESIYMGIKHGDGTSPTMSNYEFSDRFEAEFIVPESRESLIRVKHTANKVLHANEGDDMLFYKGHTAGIEQRWKILHGSLNSVKFKNQHLCLEWLPEARHLNLETCTENDNQLFLMVEDDDEDHGLATKAGVTCNKRQDDNGVYD